ncbi:MAG: TonB-dependent receptor [candidate division KSB1 bacterium]|nr:TonB-dependent receptor [candidate division KSB1 bacterium]
MKQRNRLHYLIFGLWVLVLLGALPCLLAQENERPTSWPDTTIVNADSALSILAPMVSSKPAPSDSAWITPWRIARSTYQEQFAEDIGDILYYLPGLRLADHGSAGQPLWLGRHGANPRQTAIDWSGRPLYDPITGAMDLNFIPLQFINVIDAEQRRPAASGYPAEMVTLLPVNHTETVPHSLVSYHKAPLGFSDVDISFGQPLSRKVTLLLGGIIKSYDGESQAHRFEQQNFRGRLVFQHSPRWQLEYDWLHNRLNRGLPGQRLAVGGYQSPNALQKNSRLDQTLTIHGRLGKVLEPNLKTVIYHSSIDTKFSDLDRRLAMKNSGSYAGINLEWQQPWARQLLTIAGGFHHEWTDTDEWGCRRLSTASVDIRDTWQWHEKVGIGVLGGIRVQDRGGVGINGRLDLFWRSSKHLKWTASLNQTVRYPTLFELYASTDYSGNSDLKNETHRKLAWGAEWKPAPSLELKAAAYLRKISQPIDLSPAYVLQPVFYNAPRTHYTGFDFQSDWNITAKWQSHAFLTLMDRDEPPKGPFVQFIHYLQYTNSFFQNDLQPTLRLETRYFGYRKGWFSIPRDLSAAGRSYQSVLILNGQLLLAIGNLKLFFLLENIFDYEYALVDGYLMNGRTFHYGVRWEFWD